MPKPPYINITLTNVQISSDVVPRWETATFDVVRFHHNDKDLYSMYKLGCLIHKTDDKHYSILKKWADKEITCNLF